MSVVMLSGPVGAGKTTVARELIAISPAPLCYIEGDTFWPHFAKPDGKSQREQFRLLMRSVTAAAIPLARSGYEVLLDFSSRSTSSTQPAKSSRKSQLIL